jgi:hypothetical protein
VYQIASAMLVQVGEGQGACLAGDRAVAVGERSGDQGLVVAGQFRLAHAYAASGDDLLALHVLHGVDVVASDNPGGARQDLGRLTGACILLRAVLQARSGDAAGARIHLERAGALVVVRRTTRV